jgi:hypothetical protein
MPLTKYLASIHNSQFLFVAKENHNFSEKLLSVRAGKEMGVTDFVNSKACGKPVHEVLVHHFFSWGKAYSSIILVIFFFFFCCVLLLRMVMSTDF